MDKARARRVVISGAGVAGLTAALWLDRGGVKVTVVEKAREHRMGGYVVGLAEQAFADATHLGLMPAILARAAGIVRSRYLDKRGRTLLALDYEKLFKGLDIIQITRDDLVEAVHESLSDNVDIRFEETIAEMTQDADGVNVTFASGPAERFDLVIGADGQNSRTRSLAFSPNEVEFRHLNLMCAAFRTPNVLGLDRMFEKHLERNRYMVAHSMRQGDMGAIFIWYREDPTVPQPEERSATLRQAFTDPADATYQVLGHCPDDGDFYMDPATMILMEKWRRGRICLLGDAAHTLTLFSGRGAAAAFADAGLLARALVEHPIEQAFALFELKRIPHMQSIQAATESAVKWYVPRTPLRHFVRNSAMAVLPNRFFQAYFRHKYSTV